MANGGEHRVAASWSAEAAGLHLDVSTAHDSRTFRAFFAEYDRAFVLPSEKEEEAGFAACLALNRGAAHAGLVRSYGPFAEFVAVARLEPGGPVVGGINAIALTVDAPAGPVVTANLNYIFVPLLHRGQGLLRPLLAATRSIVENLLPPAPGARALIFVEQNDPFRMSPDDYAADTAHAGIDQFDRLLVWARAGARVLEFDYVQPALSPDQEPDETLVYAVLDPPGAAIDAALLAGHLERFFAISVFKGRPLGGEATASLTRLHDLAARGRAVAVLDPLPVLTGGIPAAGRRPRSLPAAIREAADAR